MRAGLRGVRGGAPVAPAPRRVPPVRELAGRRGSGGPPGADPLDRLDLHAAIGRLPAGQRTVLVLRYFEGLDVNEMVTY